MKRVWIEPGCTSCGACEVVCPAVFEVRELSAVRDGADIVAHEQEIKDAAHICPVQVIAYEE